MYIRVRYPQYWIDTVNLVIPSLELDGCNKPARRCSTSIRNSLKKPQNKISESRFAMVASVGCQTLFSVMGLVAGVSCCHLLLHQPMRYKVQFSDAKWSTTYQWTKNHCFWFMNCCCQFSFSSPHQWQWSLAKCWKARSSTDCPWHWNIALSWCSAGRSFTNFSF